MILYTTKYQNFNRKSRIKSVINMSYEVHHRRYYNTPNDFALIAKCKTLEEAKKKRVVSGDLVVHAHNHKIVVNSEWLWDWEKKDSYCYARRAISSEMEE